MHQVRPRGECLLLVYIDDVLSSAEVMADVKPQLKQRFEMTDSSVCNFVLGIELVINTDGSVTLCQRRYVNDILKRFGIEDCKSVATPVHISVICSPSQEADYVLKLDRGSSVGDVDRNNKTGVKRTCLKHFEGRFTDGLEVAIIEVWRCVKRVIYFVTNLVKCVA